jgi:dTDP-4-amino-4,6-dideoxygalactose transaminase
VTRNVPFIDLRAQHQALRQELDAAMQAVMDRGDFALGKDVTLFEQEFADFCGTNYAVGVDSGLSALELSLRALGVGPGDEVIVPAHTFVATAAAATFAGATPVLVDIDEKTYDIDVTQIEAAITPNTKAIIPVHLYGQPADMDAIMALAEKNDLVVVEDACQAHGARYKERSTGSLGHAGAFSFYPTKNLGACGDAGMVVTDDAEVVEKVRAMRNCGQREKYLHELPPFNHRLDTLQAAVLRVKLPHLRDWVEARRQHANRYTELLQDSDVVIPYDAPEATHVYHLYVIRIQGKDRDACVEQLHDRGVGAGIHYPIPVHMQPYYDDRGFYSGQFPVTERVCSEIVSLPMFPELTNEQIDYVCEQVLAL